MVKKALPSYRSLEGEINAARNAAEVAACMMEFIHRDDNIPDHIIYAVYQARDAAQAAWEEFYADHKSEAAA